MDEKHKTLAQEMAALCQKSVKERVALYQLPMLATLVSAVLVVLALDPTPLTPVWFG